MSTMNFVGFGNQAQGSHYEGMLDTPGTCPFQAKLSHQQILNQAELNP